jgi:hypothetical protein
MPVQVVNHISNGDPTSGSYPVHANPGNSNGTFQNVYTVEEANSKYTQLISLQNDLKLNLQDVKSKLEAKDSALNVKIDESIQNIDDFLNKLPDLISSDEELIKKIAVEVQKVISQ